MKAFAAALCEAWEHAALAASGAAQRIAIARFGIVLGSDGGALAKLVRAARWTFARSLGDGSQWVPWVHIADAVRAIGHLPTRLAGESLVRGAEAAGDLRSPRARDPVAIRIA